MQSSVRVQPADLSPVRGIMAGGHNTVRDQDLYFRRKINNIVKKNNNSA